MAVRFRIRTSAGQELSFASHDTFEVFVRDGDLSPDDLIYDGETGSWSPARTHPIVLEIEYERGDEREPAPTTDGAQEPGLPAGEATEDPGAPDVSLPAADSGGSAEEARRSQDELSPASEDLGFDGAPVETERGGGGDTAEGEEEDPGAAGVGTEDDGRSGPAPEARSLGDHPASGTPAGGASEHESDPFSAREVPDGLDSTPEQGPLPETDSLSEPDPRPETDPLSALGQLSGLELAPADPEPPDEETRAFVERMESERQADFGRDVPGARRGGPAGVILGDAAALGDLPAAPPGTTRTDAELERLRAERDRQRTWEPVASSHPWRATVEDRSVGSAVRPATRASRGARVVGLAMAILLLGGTGGYAGFRLVNAEQPSPPATPPSEPMRPIEVLPEPPAVEPDPEIASTPGALQERAQERFLTATRTELRGLDEIPTIWARGEYIVLPSEYPEVVDVWQSYLDTIRRVRAGDLARYRAAFVAALDDAGVDGEAREERLAAGMLEFMSRTAQRDAHYRRVVELANTAIRAHNELIEAEGLILFDRTVPAVESGVIGAGLSGRNAESQRLLEEVVEVLEERLSSGGKGAGSGTHVRAWVWDGFLAAMTES
jgi:hypothetical protein